MSKQQDQVDRNYNAFVKRLPELMQSHGGKFALMRDGEIVAFFDTAAMLMWLDRRCISRILIFLFRKLYRDN